MRKASQRFFLWRLLWLLYGVCAFLLACVGMEHHPRLAGATFLFSALCFGAMFRYMHRQLEARQFEAYRAMLITVAHASAVLVPVGGRTCPLFFSQAAIDALADYYERFGDDERGVMRGWRQLLHISFQEGASIPPKLLPFMQEERSDFAWQ